MSTSTRAFIAAHGIDPFVRLRSGVQLPLSECGIFARRLMQILAAAVRKEPGAAAFIGIGMDDRPDIVATIFVDPEFAETDTPGTAEIDLDGTPAMVEFSGMDASDSYTHALTGSKFIPDRATELYS